MGNNLDNYLGIHVKSLLLREQRASQLAMNIANADTPNYKAKDIDFNSTLKKAVSSQGGGSVSGLSTEMKYRIPNHLSLDGNTVDKDIETMEFTRNALSYQASLTFLDNKIKSMMSVLKGD